MEQTGAAGFLGVEAELRGHHGAQVGRLAGVLQQILTVARAVFHLAHHAYQVGVQSVYAQVDGGALAGFDDFLLDLPAYLGHHLLDAGRVYAAVGDELVQGQAGDLAAHGVKSRQHDGLGGIVDDNLDAGGRLQGAYVAAFAADNAALDLVGVDVEDGDRVLDGSLGGDALDGLHHDALGLLVGGHFGLVHDVVDVRCGRGLGLVAE